MTLQEFSTEFDILYNNISSNQAPGLTEYEKSVFLTQAQDALVLDLYKGTTGDSFETTEEVTRYLNTLVKSESFSHLSSEDYLENIKQTEVTLLPDVMFITYQVAKSDDNWCLVIPSRQDSLYKELQNPFKGPNNKRILCTSEENKIILYSKKDIQDFKIKYLKFPTPIILENCEEGDTIKGKSVNSSLECELPESVHQMILIRAVQMAKAVWA